MELTNEEIIKKLEDLYNRLDAFLNQPIINVTPLDEKDLTSALVTFYCVSNGFETQYFDTLEEREEWLLTHKYGVNYRYTSEYLGNVLDKSNVFKQVDEKGNTRLLAITDKYEYDVCNYNKGKAIGKWEHYIDETLDKCLLLSLISEKDNNKEKNL